MDIEEILKFINSEMPCHAREIWDAIDLLVKAFENTRCAIDGSVGKLSSNREYDKANEYINMSKNISEILDIGEKYIEEFAVIKETEFEQIVDEKEKEQVVLKDKKINYEDYRVDETVAYDIHIDFTHKKPAAFSLNGKKYSAKKWKYVFIQTCEIFAQINPILFDSFSVDRTMQGRSRAYFSRVKEDIRKPKKITGTNVYIETNLNANTIRDIIVNMLDKYGMSKKEYQIYLSKDLTSLHNDESKIKDAITSEEKDISPQNICVSENDKINIYDNLDDFRFSKESYIKKEEPICNVLTEKIGTPSHIEYLKMSEDDTRRHRARCKEYDNKKNVCMCVKSPYFTIHCGGASHCKYYSEDKKENAMKEDIKSVEDKEKIYVVCAEIQKQRKCTKCQSKTERKMLNIFYKNETQEISNKLGVYKCLKCGRKHLIDTLYKTYTSNKNLENISVEFVKS